MSWLSGTEIAKKIEECGDVATREAFSGVYSIDSLPFAVKQYPFFMIVNTQTHNLPGEHWKTIFIDRNKCGEVFDSLALPLSNTLIRWLNRFTRRFVVNRIAYQNPLSATCGSFAVFYVLNRLDDPKCVTTMFDGTPHENDKRVLAYYCTLLK